MVILSIDFDGTIVKDEYPGIGKALPGAIQAINELYDDGYCIIINSCRARDKEDDFCVNCHHSIEHNSSEIPNSSSDEPLSNP